MRLSLLLILMAALSMGGQQSASGVPDLVRLQDYEAFRSSSNNPDPLSNDDSKRPIPGQSVVLADLQGPGLITHIWITVASNEYGWPRLLRFQVFYDGSETPSIDAPLGDFFAVGLGQERNVNSLMVRNSSEGRSRNSYWPMPFRKSCRIVVTNEGTRRVANLYYHVDWRKVPSLPEDTTYLHAWYHQELPTVRGRNYEFLNVTGRGHYVGTVFSVVQREAGWFGEGDEFFFVDGARKPSIEGTGTEDYFNDAWSLRVSDGPYFGVTLAQGTGVASRMSAYRWHTVDPVPFTRSLQFNIEHAGWTFTADGRVRSAFEERQDLFSSVAFWYHHGIAKGLPPPPYGYARLPHGNARQIEVEKAVQDAKAESGSLEVQPEVFWSRDLLFLKANGVGSKMHVPFDVTGPGEYEIIAQLAHSPDYGIYQVQLDGKPLGADGALEHEPGANVGDVGSIDAWNSEIYVAEDHTLGWTRLSAGRHVLTFTCTGKNEKSSGYNLGIDTLVLAKLDSIEPVGGSKAQAIRRSSDPAALRQALADPDAYVRLGAAWRLTQDPSLSPTLLPELIRALDDPDAPTRGLAALAISLNRDSAVSAVPRLTAALRDRDENVRMMAAAGLATAGAASLPSLDALIRASQVSGEQVHVLRNLASAMGAIGPGADAALPALRKLEEMPRVRWAAQAAMRQIQQKP